MISRPINGIPLNGKEQLLEDDGKTLKLFDSKEEALQFLAEHGFSEKDLQDYWIDIDEYLEE